MYYIYVLVHYEELPYIVMKCPTISDWQAGDPGAGNAVLV